MGLRRNLLFGLRRRNNELYELTNCCAADDWGASIVAHFASKVRGTIFMANTRRSTVASSAAKHCSSLCLQSEGDVDYSELRRKGAGVFIANL